MQRLDCQADALRSRGQEGGGQPGEGSFKAQQFWVGTFAVLPTLLLLLLLLLLPGHCWAAFLS